MSEWGGEKSSPAKFITDVTAVCISVCIAAIGLYGVDFIIDGIRHGSAIIALSGCILVLATVVAALVISYTVWETRESQD